MENIILNNNLECPVIGIGTFMLSPAEAENSVRETLKMGCSLVDTANAYVNERACGRGIKDSGLKREEVFISTKLWPSEYENETAVDDTLGRLGVDYVDLLYIHQPAGNWMAGYRQLEKAYKDGKAKSIGISNFEGKYIEELQTKWEIVPQFIQVEAHPYFTQQELRKTLDKYGIKLMSWYPLGHGDLSSREDILLLIAKAQEFGEIKYLVNAAGVSPSQAPIEAILKVDLYGTAVLLEEVGKVIAEGGAGITISSQSGWRMPQLTPEQDRQLAMTPTEELLSLDILQPENIKDTLHAYQMAKRCNEKRVMYECVRWGERGARLNDIAPGIIVTPLAIDEFNGPRGDFYKNMFAKCPAGRPGTADEVANIAELLMSDAGAFITDSTFLADGGATASYYYGPLQPRE